MPVEDSTMRNAITFLSDMGIFDVVLPFVLVFTVVYAILEKSRIFGVETIKGETYTRKNLNSMFAFVTAFLVVASTQIVATINKVLAEIVLLLLLGVCILLLAGTFHTGDKEFQLDKMYRGLLVGLMIVGTILIFLNALPAADGKTWLEWGYEWIRDNFDTGAFGALFLALLMIAFIFWVTGSPKAVGSKKEE
jgi:hypothetical protein